MTRCLQRLGEERLTVLLQESLRVAHPDGHAPNKRFDPLRHLAIKVRYQDHKQRGAKVYALHAPEVECIGKGKARTPYEFGCKVSLAIPVTQPKSGQFVLHAKALHGNPFDGHPLKQAVDDIEKNTGIMSAASMSTRAAAATTNRTSSGSGSPVRSEEPQPPSSLVIGHVKTDCRMDRNFLRGRDGDRINPVLAAVGFNFRLLVRWLAVILALIYAAILSAPYTEKPSLIKKRRVLHGGLGIS